MKIRRPRCARMALLLTAWIIGASPLLPAGTAADEPAARNGEISVRHVFVPARHPDAWPPGNWQPIPQAELQRKLAAASRRPDRAQVERAQYSAVLAGDALREGKFQWHIRNREQNPSFLTFDSPPPNLQLERLTWETTNGAAAARVLSGTSGDGRFGLIVDRREGVVSGAWSLPGRQVSRTLEFDVRLPAADVSTLELTLPADRTLVSSEGDVLPPRSATVAGFNVWIVELGGNRDFRLTIRRRPDAGSARPLVLVEKSTTVALRRDLARIQVELQIESLESVLSELNLEIDPGLELLGIAYGDGGTVEWTRPDNSDARHVKVQLPEPQSGELPVLLVHGLARLNSTQAWTIPDLRLADAVETDCRIALRLPSPQEIADLRLNGFRQVEMTAHPTDGETRLLRRLQRDGSVAIVRAADSAEFFCQSFSLLRLASERLHCETELRWSGRLGRVFTANCQVPEGWEVVDIRVPAESGADPQFDWDLATAGPSAGLLTVRFREPLATGMSRRLVVVSKRTVPFPQQELALPIFAAVEPAETEDWIVVESTAQHRVALSDSSGIEILSVDKMPNDWEGGRKWRDERFNAESLPIVIRTRDQKTAARISFQKRDDPRVVEAVEPAPPIVPAAATPPLDVELLDLEMAVSCGADSVDRYVARYHVAGWQGERAFRWRLDESAVLINVSVDGMVVVPRQIRDHYVVVAPPGIVRASGGARDRRVVEIQYDCPGAACFGVARREVRLPAIDFAVGRFQFSVQLPERVRLRQQPEGIVFNEFDETDNRWFALLGPFAAMIDEFALDGSGVPERRLRRRLTAADHVPERIVLFLGETQQTGALCWCLFLASTICGSILKARQGRRAWLVACGIALISGAGVALAPVMWVDFFGSALAGIALSRLVPLRLLVRSDAEPRSQVVPQGSTRSFAQVGALLLACVLIARHGDSSAQAQNSGSAGPAPAAPIGRAKVETVLIPLDEDGKPPSRNPVVYISAKLAERLQQQSGPEQSAGVPDYLLSRASYAAEIQEDQSVAVSALFEVVVLAEQAAIDVRLPLADVSLAGALACRVDGQVRPAVSAPNNGGLMIAVPGAIRPVEPAAEPAGRSGSAALHSVAHSIEVKFFVPVEETDRLRTTSWGIPRLACSQLTVTATPRAVGSRIVVKLPPVERTLEITDDLRTATLNCGAAGTIALQWPRTLPAPAETPAIQAAVSILADLDPHFVVLRYQVEYRIPSGSISSLEWSVPRDCSVWSISAPDLLGYALSPAGDRVRRLSLEFSRPQKTSLVVSAAFVLPLRLEQDALRIPIESINQGEAQGERISVTLNQLALRSGVEYEFEVDADRQNALLRPRTVDEFVASTRLQGPRPQQAFAIVLAGELPVTLKPRSTALAISSEATIHVQRDRALVLWQAEVEPHPVPLFQYRLHLDPRWRIGKVSVQEDGVERVLRWSRLGDTLVVFLHDHSTARQTILVEASTPLSPPDEFDVTQIQIEGANRKSRLWTLIEDPDVDAVGVDAAGNSLPSETPAEERDPGALPKRRILVPDDMGALRIRATPETSGR